jgi:DNA-binding CsgD family transcriptional regulator/sugar lactone lactonase YvrE
MLIAQLLTGSTIGWPLGAAGRHWQASPPVPMGQITHRSTHSGTHFLVSNVFVGNSGVVQGSPDGGPSLTRREQEVAALVAEGLTNRQIADRLFISERTADRHLEHIRQKLGVSSRASVAAWFVDHARQPLAAETVLPAGTRAGRGASRLGPRGRRARVMAATTMAIAVVLVAGVASYLRWANSAPSAGAVVTTVAGLSPVGRFEGGDTGDFGPASAAQLYHPLGIATGPNGTLYIADSLNNVVRKVDPGGTITTVAGGGQSPLVDRAIGTSVQLPAVAAVAVGPHGWLYLAGGPFVMRLDADLLLHILLGPATPEPLTDVTGLASGPDGSLYIADQGGHMVRKLASDGSLLTYAGTGQPGFYGDGGAAAGAQLNFPAGLALDSAGNLYIADEGNNRIRRVDALTAVIITVAGSSGAYAYGGDGGPAVRAKLSLPRAVVIGGDGRIYIADTGNNRVRLVTPEGVISTVAGTGLEGFRGDGGRAAEAEFSGPAGLAVASSGDLYVADSANNRIRELRQIGRGDRASPA